MAKYKLSKWQTAVEVLRPWILLSAYILLSLNGHWVWAGLFALFTVLGGFVQMHDTMHSSLGLSKKFNSVLLTLSGLLLLKSGHGMQVTHLRHHGMCLSENDPEGEPANWKFAKVLFQGPYHILTLRLASLKIAPKTRNIQLFETFLTLAILVFFVWIYFQTGSMIGLLYWSIAFVMSCTLPIWATYIPHHLAPRNPLRLFSLKLTRIWTPVISSFAFHHVHHNHPKVPTVLLPLVAHEEDAVFEEHSH